MSPWQAETAWLAQWHCKRSPASDAMESDRSAHPSSAPHRRRFQKDLDALYARMAQAQAKKPNKPETLNKT